MCNFSWNKWSLMMENQFDDARERRKSLCEYASANLARLLITIHCWWLRRYCLLLLVMVVLLLSVKEQQQQQEQQQNSCRRSSTVGYFKLIRIIAKWKPTTLSESVRFIVANSSYVAVLRLWNAINKFHNIKKQHSLHSFVHRVNAISKRFGE